MKVPYVDLARAYESFAPEIDRCLLETARSGAYILGENVAALEQAMASYLGVAHAIAVGSGTDALQLAMAALSLEPGDEVVTTPFTFAATVEAIEQVGARPLLVDIDAETFNIDPDLLDAAITSRTRAILPVHMFGLPAAMGSIMDVARRHDLAVVEDCAQSLGARIEGVPVGSMGAMSTFSFYPTKTLAGLGDGGMIAASDEATDRCLRQLRNHGIDPEGDHVMLGYNSRLDELQAAVLRLKLERLDEMNARRRSIAAHYGEALAGTSAQLPSEPCGAHHVYGYYTIRVNDRDALRADLQRKGVATALYYAKPLHHHPHFSKTCRFTALPVSEAVAAQCISLPIFPEMTDSEVDYVASTVASLVR